MSGRGQQPLGAYSSTPDPTLVGRPDRSKAAGQDAVKRSLSNAITSGLVALIFPSRHGARAGPICGARTGLATPCDRYPPDLRSGLRATRLECRRTYQCTGVIDRPDIACRIDGKIGLHPQPAANVATERRVLVAGLHAR